MNRDSNGKFIAKEKLNLEISMPPIITILFWIVIVIVLLLWISIIIRNELFSKLFVFLDKLISGTVGVTQPATGNGTKDTWAA